MTIEEKIIKLMKKKQAKYNEIQAWFSNEYNMHTSSVRIANEKDAEAARLWIEMQVLTELMLKP